MGTRTNPDQFDCYERALDDEPTFTLLARDRSAPDAVLQWAYMREREIHTGLRPESDRARTIAARACAKAMKAWREENDGKWRQA